MAVVGVKLVLYVCAVPESKPVADYLASSYPDDKRWDLKAS